MYRDSTASAVNKLSGKGLKNGIFLTENCTTVIAQIGTTAVLHCEVSDITENTVSLLDFVVYKLCFTNDFIKAFHMLRFFIVRHS